uniref:CS domain-containing protein n=1 Tax=Corethron hystrix TaxID=216773 RepID=A0A7S1BWG7_9STRA|mmetsp:Transcript_4666/g.9127  ORF Transcript_4666/g.9127 Transcript_4666/m.9127 type:complete len:307 (+) Transcript_4666:55-975(+)
MSRIDYSKWDHFDDCSSSDEHESTVGKPRVTSFDRPSTVTRSKDGNLTVDSSPENSLKNDIDGRLDTSLEKRFVSQKSISEQSLKKKVSLCESKLSVGGGTFVDSITKSRIIWSQDRYNVIISVPFDPCKIAPKDIRVKLVGALSFSDRFSAVGGELNSEGHEQGHKKGSLSVTTTRCSSSEGNSLSSVLFEGSLPHFVHLAEDEDGAEWEFENFEHFHLDPAEIGEETKLLRVTFRKAVPMQGISIWWDRPFSHCPAIDTKKIQQRNESSQSQAIDSWNEAHQLFREKMKRKKQENNPLNIDLKE